MKKDTPMRYWFDEGNNTLFQLAEPPPDGTGIIEVTEADYKEYGAFVRAEEAKAAAVRDHGDE
jgi:hypothetical protein